MSLKNSPGFLLNFSEGEMNDERKHFYQFKSFRLDVGERQLLKDKFPVALTPKAFDVLAALVERSGRLVEKDELLRIVWADSFVEEANVARIVHTLRKTLGEDENGNKYIETVPTRGYRFIAEVREEFEPIARSAENDSREEITDADDVMEISEPPDTAHNVEPAAALHTNQEVSKRWLIAGFAVLIAVALVSFFALAWNTNESSNSERPITIAILPFNPISENDRDEANDLGLAFLLINQLSQSKNLRVRPFPAIKNYTDVKQDAVVIGKKLKADYVLESNYLINDGQILITSELHNVGSGAVEETFNYNVDAANRFKDGNIIVANLGKDLLAKLNFEPVNFALKRDTTNEEAQRLYFHGIYLTDKRTREDAEKAIADFEKAVALDPNYAQAYAGLAYAHTTAKVNGADSSFHCAKALETAQHALSLDASLAEAYSILAMNQHSCQWDQKAAENSHRKAVELSPNSAFVHRFYGIYLTHLGKVGESVKEIKISIELDPTSLFSQKQLGRALFFGGRYDEAIKQLKATRELDANDPEQAGFIFTAYQMKGDFDRALEWFLITQTIKGAKETELNSWKDIYAESGWQGVLRKRLEIAEQKEKAGGNNFGEIASLAAQLGEKDKAFAYLEKEMPLARLFAAQMLVDPTLNSLRSDSRFDDLVKRWWKT